ncbi:hypothetical protein [Spirosoma profusum]|nr:hypothetical protein [Spirosoma profusum]
MLNLTNTGKYEFIGPTGIDKKSKGKWSLAINNTQLILTDSSNPLASMTFTLDSFSAAGLYVTHHAKETLILQSAGIDSQGANQVDYAFNYVPAK